MNNTKTKKLALALFAVVGFAGLSGCASTPTAPQLAAADTPQVSRPAPTYGSLGGYRYRRLVATPIAAGS